VGQETLNTAAAESLAADRRDWSGCLRIRGGRASRSNRRTTGDQRCACRRPRSGLRRPPDDNLGLDALRLTGNPADSAEVEASSAAPCGTTTVRAVYSVSTAEFLRAPGPGIEEAVGDNDATIGVSRRHRCGHRMATGTDRRSLSRSPAASGARPRLAVSAWPPSEPDVRLLRNRDTPGNTPLPELVHMRRHLLLLRNCDTPGDTPLRTSR
jgi:hypothetical protein